MPNPIALLDALKKLTPPEFEEVLTRYGLDRAYLSSKAPQVTQATELLHHAQSNGQLEHLAAALAALHPPPEPPAKLRSKTIRWYSTVASAENLEFSMLAAVESVCAVSLSLWLAWYFQTYTHLIVAVILAPLLLLRTEESTELGLKWFIKPIGTYLLLILI